MGEASPDRVRRRVDLDVIVKPSCGGRGATPGSRLPVELLGLAIGAGGDEHVDDGGQP